MTPQFPICIKKWLDLGSRCAALRPINKWLNSLHLTAIFPGGPGLAGTRISPFWILLELRVMEVVVASGAIRRHAKLQSNC